MPRSARVHPLVGALKTYKEQRRNSFVVESEIRALGSFHDKNHRFDATITISRADWDLLEQGRSDFVHLGFCGGHAIKINGCSV